MLRTHWKRITLAAILASLGLFWPLLLPACHPEPPIPPKVSCPLPDVHPAVLQDPVGSDGGLVTLSPRDAAAIGLMLREECRRIVVAEACLGLPPSMECPE